MTQILIALTAMTLMLNQTSVFAGFDLLAEGRWVFLGLFPLLIAGSEQSLLRMRRLQGFDFIAIGFLLLALFSTVYSEFPDTTWQRAVSAILLYFAVFWAIWNYADRGGEERIRNVLVGVTAITLVFGFVNIFEEPGPWQSDGRYRGLLINPNSLALLISITLPLVMWRCLEYRRYFDIGLLLIMVVSLLLSQSRNGLLANTAAITYLLFRTKGVKVALPVMLMMLMLYAYIAVGGADGIVDLLDTTGDYVSFAHLSPDAESLRTGSGRMEVLEATWPLIKERWFLGYGFGTEEFALDAPTYGFEEFSGGYFHNSYTGLTYQLGFLGSILFYAPLMVFIANRMRTPNQSRSNSVIFAYEAVVLAGLIAALFESWIYSVGNAFSFPFWICVMLAVRRSRMERAEISRNTAPKAAWN